MKKLLTAILLLLTTALIGCAPAMEQDTLPAETAGTAPAATEAIPTETPSSTEAPVSAEEPASQPEIPDYDPSAPMVALTFDDGPYGNSTDRILNILEANNARATFFVIGRNVAKFPEAIPRMMELGCQLGNHTYDHINLSDLSVTEMTEQIDKVNAALETAGGEAARLIRPPHGEVSDAMKENLHAPMILWSIDTRDWSSKDAEDIKSKVLDQVQDGDIVLMHDVYESTADACEVIIPELVNRGFQLVTVEELMAAKGVEMQPGVVYQKPGVEGGF